MQKSRFGPGTLTAVLVWAALVARVATAQTPTDAAAIVQRREPHPLGGAAQVSRVYLGVNVGVGIVSNNRDVRSNGATGFLGELVAQAGYWPAGWTLGPTGRAGSIVTGSLLGDDDESTFVEPGLGILDRKPHIDTLASLGAGLGYVTHHHCSLLGDSCDPVRHRTDAIASISLQLLFHTISPGLGIGPYVRFETYRFDSIGGAIGVQAGVTF